MPSTQSQATRSRAFRRSSLPGGYSLTPEQLVMVGS